MTNAEKFKEVFGIEIDCGSCNPYPCNENDCEFWEQCESEPGQPCASWWDWEFKEPTTKNDLVVDCISRADALALYCDKCGIYNCTSKCSSYRAVEKMPSVTPLEPILDKIRVEIQDNAFDWQEIDGEHESFMVVDLNDALNIIDKYKAGAENT